MRVTFFLGSPVYRVRSALPPPLPPSLLASAIHHSRLLLSACSHEFWEVPLHPSCLPTSGHQMNPMASYVFCLVRYASCIAGSWLFIIPVRVFGAAYYWICLWGYPTPRGSHPPCCPPPRESCGSVWEGQAGGQSSRSRSSTPGPVQRRRVQRAENYPRPRTRTGAISEFRCVH